MERRNLQTQISQRGADVAQAEVSGDSISPRVQTISSSTIGTFLPEEPSRSASNRDERYGCTCCRMLLASDCDCVKGFPIWLTKKMRDETPVGLLRREVNGYIERVTIEQTKKEAKISRGKEKGPKKKLVRVGVEEGYACGVCRFKPKKDHVCHVEKINRGLLEAMRNAVPSTFPHLKLVGDFLQREVVNEIAAESEESWVMKEGMSADINDVGDQIVSHVRGAMARVSQLMNLTVFCPS